MPKKTTETMKKIVIMGATSGIGLHVAEKLAARGYMVGAAGRNTVVLEQLGKLHPENIRVARIDVTDPDAPVRLGELIAAIGGMDTYFHVAGIGFDSYPLDPAKEEATMQTNVMGFTRMIDAAFCYFRDRNGGRGHIAAITSVAGTNGIGRLASYSASKAFQQTYLKALDQQAHIAGMHIRFTDIRPGWVRTPLLDNHQNYPMIMQLPYAVKRIIKAVGHRRRVAVIDWRWNLLVGLWRLVPDCLWVRLPIKVSSLATARQTRLNAAEAVEDQQGVS